jgi:hypothetical protein
MVIGDRRREMAVTPMVNANVGANANALVNANALANANANVNANANGLSLVEIPGNLVRLHLAAEFEQSPLGVRLGQMGLNESRQRALLKAVLIDASNVVAEHSAEGGEFRRAVYNYRGVKFQIEARHSAGELEVVNSQILD